MERVLKKVVALAVCLFFLLISFPQGFAASDIQLISKEDLKKMLDDPAVAVIDVRVERAWKSADTKIKGAAWEDPTDVGAWAKKYSKEKTLVLYCS
jgi:rhodanese-related sulfurtransferase